MVGVGGQVLARRGLGPRRSLKAERKKLIKPQRENK